MAAQDPRSRLRHISPPDAWALLQSNPAAVLIDVRSTMEYLFVGHPVGAVHIAWIDEPDWTINPDFVREVRKLMLGGLSCPVGECPPVLLICRSGKRSVEAGMALLEDGFPEVYVVEGGFEGPLDEHHHRSTIAGWRFHGLPWEQC